jgi:fatty-acyl-CoA synthase
MHTGDMAVMDKEGYITISGRIKDLIIRGGENISPKEIEDFLYTYPIFWMFRSLEFQVKNLEKK